MLATNCANHPGDGITLRQNRSTSHVIWRERAASGPRQGRKNIRKCSETASQTKIFDFWAPAKMRFLRPKFRNFGVMEKLAWFSITLSIRNVESSYSQRIKPWPIWVDQSWGFFILGPQQRADRPRTSIFHNRPAACSLSNCPSLGITLRCNHSTSHIPVIRGTRARSERPPAGPKKYT